MYVTGRITMKKILSKTGFTLIELIVSLMLVSVVVLGIFAINNVLSNNNQDYGQKYLVRSETQATLNHILNNASLAVGNTTTDPYGNLEQGILIGAAGMGDANSFCVHQDMPPNPIDNAPVNYPSSAPPDYSNSRWLCYTWYPSTNPTTPNQIFYCATPYNDSLSYRGAASCNGIANSQFLGTAYSIANPAPPAFTNVTFSITLQNCLNNSLSTCSSTGASTDPANNPEVQVSGSVSTPQESM